MANLPPPPMQFYPNTIRVNDFSDSLMFRMCVMFTIIILKCVMNLYLGNIMYEAHEIMSISCCQINRLKVNPTKEFVLWKYHVCGMRISCCQTNRLKVNTTECWAFNNTV